MTINQELIDKLFDEAKVNPRLRTNLDLRTSSEDNSQRMLNALLPGTVVAIHRDRGDRSASRGGVRVQVELLSSA